MPNKYAGETDFEIIMSRQNSRIKALKKLSLKKYRFEKKEFLVENITIIQDALLNGYDFESLFITKEFLAKNSERINLLREKSKCVNYFLIDNRINELFSQLDTAAGIAAIYKMPSRNFCSGSVVYLESISDPGNLGAILRSALAFGFKNIAINENCADLYNSKSISAARNAIFKLNILEDHNYSWLKKNTLPIYATSSHDGQALSQFKPAKAYILALGNESRGVSQTIIDMALKKIKIEISPEIESLNVASAAAILFYALRQNLWSRNLNSRPLLVPFGHNL